MKALVFGGGGARGAYQIGAWRALEELDRSFDIVTGTSVGALNAALYVQGDQAAAEQLWRQMTIDQIVKADNDILNRLVNYDIGGKDIKHIIDFFRQTIGQSGLDISPLKQMVNCYIDEQKLRQSSVKLGIVTFSLTDMKPLELSIDQIPQGQLADYLIASANLPVFKLERRQGKLMIDGGFYDNVPVNLAKKMGGTSFTVIDLKAMGFNRNSDDVEKLTIAPIDDLGGTLELAPQKIERNLSLGYYDTLRAYRHYKGRRYYISDSVPSSAILAKFIDIDSANCHYLKQLLMETDSDDYRFIFEVLLAQIAKSLDYKRGDSYVDIYLGLLEKIATSLDIERFKVWPLRDFEVVIRQNYKPGNILKIEKTMLKKIISRLHSMSEGDDIKFYNTIYEKLVR